eukprot:5369775-Pyramimonas_sp.AAC.1
MRGVRPPAPCQTRSTLPWFVLQGGVGHAENSGVGARPRARGGVGHACIPQRLGGRVLGSGWRASPLPR